MAGFDMSELGQKMGDWTGDKAAGKAKQAAEDAQKMVEGAIAAIEQGINDAIEEILTSSIDKLYEAMHISEGMDYIKPLLKLTNTGLTYAENYLSMVPPGTQFPGVVEIGSSLAASVKETAMGMYADLVFQYTKMGMTALSLIPTPMEALTAAITLVLDEIEKIVEENIQKYTGFSLLEAYNRIVVLVQLYKQYNKMKKENEDKHAAGQEVDVDVAISAPNDGPANEIKIKIQEQIKQIGIPLYNAFLILNIKDTALQIKEQVQRFTNVSTENWFGSITDLDDVVEMLDQLLGTDPTVITLEDIIQMGLNRVAAATAEAKKSLDAINNSKDMFSEYSTSQLIGGAASMVDFQGTVRQTYEFVLDEEKTNNDKDGITYFNVIFYKTPEKLKKDIKKALQKIQLDNQQIIDNADIVSFTEQCIEFWNNELSDQEISLIANIEGVKRIYKFNIKNDPDGAPETKTQTTSGKSEFEQENVSEMAQGMLNSLNNGLQELMTGAPAEIYQNNEEAPLMFDIVSILLKMIKPLQPLLKTIAHYVENYKINKKKAAEAAQYGLQKSLLNSIKDLKMAKLDERYKELLDNLLNGEPEDYNFFTVRTYKLSTYIRDNYKLIDATQKLSGEVLSHKYTKEFLENCPKDIKNINQITKSDQPIVFYFDEEAIKTDKIGEKSYIDGTINGIDGIELDIYNNSYYLTDNKLPTIPSEIMRAMKRQYNPAK